MSKIASCTEIFDFASRLPKVHEIDFEEVIEQQHLEGWEQKWLRDGIYVGYSPPKQRKIDVVYTWINGSDPKFLEMSKIYATKDNPIQGSNRYREWDELRYTIRSVFQHLSPEWLGRIHIVTKQWFTTTGNHLQIPSWLDVALPTVQEWMQILPESALYKQSGCLPVFNSISIESQLFNIPNVTDGLVLAMSDDMFIGQDLPAGDLYSPLFGVPISLYQHVFKYNIKNEPTNGKASSQSTEKPPARYTSWLLNQRFGRRDRALQKHSPKIIDLDVMKEAIATFPSVAMKTPQLRFRGDGVQLYPWMLTSHFTIERHREALLWSYIMLRSDKNQDGYLDTLEREGNLGRYWKRETYAGD